ncbi:YcxB family protein [Algoriphagus sp. D3-2-R+10]|uniref:YcxB family protein n=1 Tax=Algoriphagus aurantiacus TaxID=3103948 RepID=UPI002B36C695|nr:YcxB family protein [Algoriphagus sp. D3-2-R+10]MEB2774459.1 YcxB family protein [Algoriphagus sp. D3-2-R+10]
MILIIKSKVEKFLKNEKNEKVIGETIMAFNEDNIQWSGRNSEGEVSINEIDKILDDRHSFYIYLSNLSALIVPKRILKPEYYAREFEDWINDTRSNSTSIKPYRLFE